MFSTLLLDPTKGPKNLALLLGRSLHETKKRNYFQTNFNTILKKYKNTTPRALGTSSMSCTVPASKITSNILVQQRSCSTNVTESEPKPRTLKDVWWFVPNKIGYLRIFLGTTMLWAPYSYYIAVALAYFACHVLDLVDGIIARKLNQTSQFGAVLDYTTDVVTHSAMLMAIASLWPQMLGPLAVVMAVEVTGCVVSMYLTASGKYWKHTDNGTPKILQKVIVNENYTNFGRGMLMIYQGFWACTWLLCCSDVYAIKVVWAILFPGALVNFWIHGAIAYEGIRKWQE